MASILVVENQILMRYPLAQWLRRGGYDVLEADSGDEAQALLSSVVTVDLVVTDMKMPGSLDGLQLTRSVRATQPQIPVIVVSGTALHSEAESAGAAAFFQKPYDLDTLVARVAELLVQRARPRSQSAKRAINDDPIGR